LGSKSPLQAMKDWYKIKPELFMKQPYYLTGCDTYVAFLPNALHSSRGIALNMSIWAMTRAQIADAMLRTM
jgi:hypothetical protein